MSEWRRFAGVGDLDQALAEHLADSLREDLDARGEASLAVSGGSTPRQMFTRLSRCELDWQRVWITLVDERWVASDDPASNERLVREHLLVNRAAAAQWVGLKADHADAVAGVAEVTRRLAPLPRPFTRVVLGMGADGHTASWFPRADNLAALLDPAGTATVGASDPVTAPHQRITLTLPAVLDSRGIIIHITGEEKRSVLEGAANAGAPVAAVLGQDRTPVSIWWTP